MQDVSRKISTGVLWSLANVFFTKGSSTIFMLFLANLLAPDAFGLIAMAMIVFELAGTFVNSGLGAALIRSKSVSNADLNTVFYTNLLLSLIAYLVLFAGAPHIADFYSQPELALLIQVMGLVVFFNAAKIVQVSVFCRNMDFKTQMQAETLSTLASGVFAVVTAWVGWGVWSLVVQMLASAFISMIFIWLASEWRPSFVFSVESFKRLFGFGVNLLIEGFFSVLYQNSYLLILGKFFSAEVTGLYFLARKISNLASQQLTRSVQQVTFPALSSIQHDRNSLGQKYRQIMQVMIFVIAPVMGLLAGLAPGLFDLVFDDSWAESVSYLQLFCVVGVLYPVHSMNINLLNIKGRSDLVLKVGIIKKIVNFIILYFTIPFGVFGIVMGQVLGSFLALIPNAYFSHHFIGYSLYDQIKDMIKPMLAAVLAGYSAWLINSADVTSLIISNIIGFTVGGFVYLISCIAFNVEGKAILLSRIRVLISKPNGL